MSQIYWKSSPIDNLTDARFFNALSNAWIEFSFNPESPRSVSINQANQISEWIFEPHLVASFGLEQSEHEIFDTLIQTNISNASIPIHHSLMTDADFLPLAFIRLGIDQLSEIHTMSVAPFAFVVQADSSINISQIEAIKILLKKSKVFLNFHTDLSKNIAKLQELPSIGVEIPTQSETKPGLAAVDIYDHLIQSIETSRR